MRASNGGRDVLVRPQDISRVVSLLDSCETSIVRSVRGADELIAGFAQLVYVDAARKWPKRIAQTRDPLHRAQSVFWIVPASHDVQLTADRAKRKRRVARSYTRDGSIERDHENARVGR